jgi:hypothetical protein
VKHFIDYPMDRVIMLANKETGEKEGRILARWTNSGTCYAMVEMYCENSYSKEYICSEGKAGGYGYDKLSAAISDALHKTGIKYDHDDIKDFTFGNGKGGKESQDIRENAKKALIEKHIIPVYSGAGNQREAFELYFKYIEIL